MDELTENAEEPDEGEKPEVQKLGKLQYKVNKIYFQINTEDNQTCNRLTFQYRKESFYIIEFGPAGV